MAGSTGNSLSHIMPSSLTTYIQKWALSLALAGLLCGSPAVAQDTLPDTNGELKDFRLDNPPPKDKPAEPAPQIEAPVAQPTIKTAAPPTKSVQRPAPQKPPANLPAQQTQPTDANAATGAGADAFSDTPPPSDASDGTTSEDAASVTIPAASSYAQYWPWLAALLAALLCVALFWVWRGRRAPIILQEQTYVKARPPVPPSPLAVKPVLASSNLTARFDPGDARLSVANLTIKGDLHLRYDGDAPLEKLTLRTRVMSACDGQKALIDAFHSDPAAGQIESLARVMPGEEIDLTLEMQVPRDALQAFDWRERRFVAPIVLINVASDDGTTTPCRVSCVVGQEGGAGSPRMQPIPIDRGPKLFDMLKLRPIAA
jgi:hypothetical protein